MYKPNVLAEKFPLSQIISPVFLLKAACQVFLGKGEGIEKGAQSFAQMLHALGMQPMVVGPQYNGHTVLSY